MGVLANLASALGLKAPITTAVGRTSQTDVLGEAAGQAGVTFDNSASTGAIIKGFTSAELYRTQPHLRTVVSFVARNAAQLGRHVYTRKEDDSRERVRDSVLGRLLDEPNDYMTGYDLFDNLFSELALYDFAIWLPVYRDGRWQIDPIPGSWVVGRDKQDGTAFGVKRYKVQPPDGSTWYWIDAKDAVVFRGYAPSGKSFGASPVVALKHILAEQIEAYEFRTQMWQRGGRIGLFLSRPKDAPWSTDAKNRFITAFRNSWSGSGGNAGSTPLLEDGMELKSVRFNAKEEQWLEAATLSLTTVAAAYHVPPAMVGVPGYNSFASVKEFRKMLYTETLGPSIAQVEDTINTRLRRLIAAPDGEYLELNIAEKLQGDFEEQAAQLFQAVGGPYMTAAEARAKMNLPFIPGTDAILAPLNMGAAGNNGPSAAEPIGDATDAQDAPEATTPPKARNEPRSSLAAPGARISLKHPSENALHEDLADFFRTQRAAVLKQLGQKDPAWWDHKKWNRELSALLTPHLTAISAGTAHQVAGAKGLPAGDYSVAQTEKFLKAVSDSRADLINATTRDHYQAAIDADDGDPEAVYEDSESRAKTVAGTLTTFITAWAAVEVVKQLAGDKRPRKTWVSSGLPNSRHDDMDGETVPVDEPFSNGAMWPGDPVLGAEGVANCGCGVEVEYDD